MAVPKKKAKKPVNRVTVRNGGVLTLHLNGERFAVDLDDTIELNRLPSHCEAAGETRLARDLKRIIALVTRPAPRTVEAWQSETDLVREDAGRVVSATITGLMSVEDSKSMTAINGYRLKKLEQQLALLKTSGR
ncbi:MAG: hypothetical protein JWO19_4492 [Bryobacterales bacterium]|nr:hypothetical protein [Bryobacterales bacterium]